MIKLYKIRLLPPLLFMTYTNTNTSRAALSLYVAAAADVNWIKDNIDLISAPPQKTTEPRAMAAHCLGVRAHYQTNKENYPDNLGYGILLSSTFI